MHKTKARVEIINDKEARIVNVYKQVRDNCEKLRFLLEFTPYSRKEYRDCQVESDDPIEDARRSICALAMGVGHSLTDLTTVFRNSKKSSAIPSQSFRTYAENFMQFHGRIKDAIIENLDWSEILEKYDDENTLFYLDPPYVHSTRTRKTGYTHEMTNEDHQSLIKKIQTLKGMVVLSGYENEIYDQLPWSKVKCETATQNASKGTEVLWLCPKTIKQSTQITMGI